MAHRTEVVDYSPVEHNPLRDSDNALLGLIESRQLRGYNIIGIRHGGILSQAAMSYSAPSRRQVDLLIAE